MNTITLKSHEALALVDTLAAYRTLLWSAKDRLATAPLDDTGQRSQVTLDAMSAILDSISDSQDLSELLIERLGR